MPPKRRGGITLLSGLSIGSVIRLSTRTTFAKFDHGLTGIQVHRILTTIIMT